MESIVLGRVVRKKYNVTPSFSPPVMEAELNILSSGIDKIVGHIKNLHDQTQRYHAIVEQNKHSTPGPHSQLNIPCNENNKYKSSRCIDRPIDEIGLSRRTARLLKSVGINTLEQLGKCSLPGLRRQARFGVKTIHEIETVLLKYGTAPAGNY